MSNRVLGVIPARIGSQRLPRKPLYPLAGRTLVEWVWLRVMQVDVLDEVVVATDSQEVLEACRIFGARAVLTSSAHESGTERVAEVAALPQYQDCGVIVNIQGDAPFVTEEQVAGSVGLVRAGWDVGTVATPIRSLEEWRDPAAVKAVRAASGAALYFSRAPIPHRRDGAPPAEELGTGLFLRHLGVYAYTPAALARWASSPLDPLERLERLEQLRALGVGLRVGLAVVPSGGDSVDTREDVNRALRLLESASQTG